jgi:hypothetical protein
MSSTAIRAFVTPAKECVGVNPEIERLMLIPVVPAKAGT